MQITETCRTGQRDTPHLRQGWWLVPSALCGATIWGLMIAAIVG
ncbi:MAG TPA: hypothetical protein VK146_16855 [Tabrizicola sp.]|nr:hypothetical protein [Tabrizicola sp.]